MNLDKIYEYVEIKKHKKWQINNKDKTYLSFLDKNKDYSKLNFANETFYLKKNIFEKVFSKKIDYIFFKTEEENGLEFYFKSSKEDFINGTDAEIEIEGHNTNIMFSKKSFEFVDSFLNEKNNINDQTDLDFIFKEASKLFIENNSEEKINKKIFNNKIEKFEKYNIKDFLNKVSIDLLKMSTKPNITLTLETLSSIYKKISLNQNLLDKEDRLNLNQNYFRTGGVDIVDGSTPSAEVVAKGVDSKNIEHFILSLFNFYNSENKLDFRESASIISFIFVYIHPYYDFNGRISRFLGELYFKKELIKYNQTTLHLKILNYISEIIRITKNWYYSSIQETRETKDLSFFVSYMSYVYSLSYAVNLLSEEVKNNFGTRELTFVEKRFLIIFLIFEQKDRGLEWSDFNNFLKENYSNQRINFILDNLERFNLIINFKNIGKKKFYKINVKKK